MHGSIQKGLRCGAALVLAMALCVTAALAAGTERKRLVPVGHTVGVKLFARGVVVVKLPEGSTPARACGLQTGDVIEACGGQTVTSTEQFQTLLQKNGTETTELSIKRQGSPVTLAVEPERNEEGVCCIGAWIRDSMAGIGTVTYFDENARTFSGLGHPICDVDTGEIMTLSTGEGVEAVITGYTTGKSGSPGELKGQFVAGRTFAGLTANGECGVCGALRPDYIPQGERLPVAFSHEVQPGPAKMLTTIAGGAPREDDVVIEKVLRGSGHAGQNMVIRVTDEALLQKTGGILQGMSGSPLVQNGMLVGAVTHVFVDEPDRGYAIFAETVRNAEKNLDQTTRNAA